jgi:hypothetical protein
MNFSSSGVREIDDDLTHVDSIQVHVSFVCYFDDQRRFAMSKTIIPTAAITGLSLGPALAANYHDYHPWSQANNAVHVNCPPEHAGPVLFHGYHYAHPARATNADTDQPAVSTRQTRSAATIRCASPNNSRQPKATT